MEAKMEGKRRHVLANPSIREGAVRRAKNAETSIVMVATPSIREGAVVSAGKMKRQAKLIWLPRLLVARE